MKNFWSGQTLLVLAPHADDEIYGAGGLMAKVKAAGGKVYVMLFSVGDLLHYKKGKKNKMVSGKTRQVEFTSAMKYLKVDGFEIIYEDSEKYMRLDAVPRRELLEIIDHRAKLSFDKLKPSVVALPFPSYNQDHEAVFKAGFAACRPHPVATKHSPRIVLGCDGPFLSWNIKNFKPNFYVDISDFLGQKLQAYKKHKSQLQQAPHFASPESVANLAKMRGSAISVTAAEAFQCYRFAA